VRRSALLGETERIPVSCWRTSPQGGIRLGEPAKQNGDERRARPGVYAVKRSGARSSAVARSNEGVEQRPKIGRGSVQSCNRRQVEPCKVSRWIKHEETPSALRFVSTDLLILQRAKITLGKALLPDLGYSNHFEYATQAM
jgi:hypothetical protein